MLCKRGKSLKVYGCSSIIKFGENEMAISEKRIYKLMHKRRKVRVVDRNSRDEKHTPEGYMLASPSEEATLPVLVYCLEKGDMWYVEFKDLSQIDMRPHPRDSNVTDLLVHNRHYEIKEYQSQESENHT